MIMNIILNMILIKYLKMAGLALATSISSIICIILLFRSLKKKIGYFGEDKIINTIMKSVISATIMGIITHYGYNFLITFLRNGVIDQIIALLVTVIISAMIYCILIITFKIEEVSILIDLLDRKLKNNIKLNFIDLGNSIWRKLWKKGY